MCNYVISCYIPCKGLYTYTLQGVHTYTVIYSTDTLQGVYTDTLQVVYTYTVICPTRGCIHKYCNILYKECIHIHIQLYTLQRVYTCTLQGVYTYTYTLQGVCVCGDSINSWCAVNSAGCTNTGECLSKLPLSGEVFSYLKTGAAGGEVSVN